MTATDARIVGLDALPAGRWDGFVADHPQGSVYHLSAWAEILRRCYRFEPRYMAVEDGEGLAGVMPLIRGRGPVTGSRLNSLPVVRWAGPLARNEDAERRLLAAAAELIDSGIAGRLQLTSARAGYENLLTGLSVAPTQPAWWLDLPGEIEEYRATFSRKSSTPRNVRKAERAGVTVRLATSRADLRAFYRLYLDVMRRRRVLPRSLRQLALARELLEPPGIFRLYVAELDGRIVAGGLFHFFGGVADLLYNASDERHLDARPNHALHWEVIRVAIEQGMRTLDFGAAREGSQLAEFKRRWGARPVERWQYTYPAAQAEKAARATGAATRLRRTQSRLVARAWEHAPLALTRLAGTISYRYL